MIIDIYVSRYQWGLGFQISLPSVSKEFFMRTKLRNGFGFRVQIGPLIIEAEPSEEIIAFECSACLLTQTGEPALSPLPGFYICQGCREKGQGQLLQLHHGHCDGKHGE